MEDWRDKMNWLVYIGGGFLIVFFWIGFLIKVIGVKTGVMPGGGVTPEASFLTTIGVVAVWAWICLRFIR